MIRPSDNEIIEVIADLLNSTFEPTTEEEEREMQPKLDRAYGVLERLEESVR